MTKIYRFLQHIVFIGLISTTFAYSQENNHLFNHVTVEQGLSQSTINCIFQDSQGFLWFGTQDGLNKYDGYTFEIFKHNPLDTNSISHNWIWDVFEDRSGNLWIATWRGLNKYNPSSGKISRFLPDENNPHSINNYRPTAIRQDKSGNLWIATWGGGLNLYNPIDNSFHFFKFDAQNDYSLSNNFIRTLFTDDEGILWIGTWDGLCCVNPESLQAGVKFICYLADPKDPHSLSGNKIVSIKSDERGNIWVGTMENGLNRFDLNTKKFTRFMHNPLNNGSISSNNISSIFKDGHGNLWIATQDIGLNRYLPSQNSFIHYTYDAGNEKGLSSNNLSALYEDKSGILWIGTVTNGLNKLNLKRKKFSLYSHSKNNKHSLSGNLVRCFFNDQKGYIWIGTAENGLNRLDPSTGQFQHAQHDPNNLFSISHNNIQAIAADEYGNLWIGTFGGGVNRFETKSGKFEHFKHDPTDDQSISSNYIEALLLDNQGSLWIGTSDKGLDRYLIESKKFDHYKFDPGDPYSISTDYILSLFQDSKGTLWIGGWGGGLNQFNAKNNRFIRYIHNPSDPRSLCDNIVNSIYESHTNGKPILWIGTSGGLSYMNLEESTIGKFHHLFESDGLPNQHIYGILEDMRGNLWFSTNKGISKFTPFNSFKNYGIEDGLPSDEFSGGAYYKSQDGKLYFGCPKGYITFNPDSIKDNNYIPPIVITSFKKFNKTVNMEGHISKVVELYLSYNDYVFSFEFSALDYTAPSKNKYAYKMEGFDNDWIHTDFKRRYASYTNLDPGTYFFRVKGSNSDGIWNEKATSLKIIIAPPFWQTWWFRIIVGTLLLCLVFLAHFYRVRHLQKSKIKQIEFSNKLIESQEAERKRIASELHDSLGQNLLIATNELQQLKQNKNDLEKGLDELSSIIKESINEVREISHNLHPHLLDRLGITKAIESMINKMSRATNIKFDTKIENIDHVLPKKSEIHFYRIIQEAMNNILKHSEANSSSVTIKKAGNQIRTILKDNGRGFQTGTPMKEGIGLKDMEERTRIISGSFHISSKPGLGTEIIISVPISKEVQIIYGR